MAKRKGRGRYNKNESRIQKAARKQQRRYEAEERVLESKRDLTKAEEQVLQTHREINELKETIHEGAQPGGYNAYDMGAVIKKYHEYIEAGLIHPSSTLDKYAAAEEFLNSYMSVNEMRAAIR